jgi:ankyrin repeat protein
MNLKINNSEAKMMSLIESGIDIDGIYNDPQNETLLHYAARYNWINTIKYLCDKGANPDILDSFGWTPLLIAAYFGHTSIVKYLLDYGADKEIKQKLTGQHPEKLALECGYFGIAELIRTHESIPVKGVHM